MKKKLIALAFLLLAPLSAYAATTHYGYVLPVVNASQNTWGTLLNAIFPTIDTNIWTASNGTVIGVNTASSATTITLTNPLNSTQNISFSASGQALVMSAANASTSPVVGGTIIVNNVGSNAFAIQANDASTVLLASLPAGQTAYLTLLTNGTANGTWQVNTYLSPSGAASLALTSSLAVGTTSASPYALKVQQAGANEAYFGSTGSNNSIVIIDNATASQYSLLSYRDAGTEQWALGKSNSNAFYLYDSVGLATYITAVSGGSLTLGAAQNVTINQTGQLDLGSDFSAVTVSGNHGVRIAQPSDNTAAIIQFTNNAQNTQRASINVDTSGNITMVPVGSLLAPTPTANDSSTKVATTAFVNPANSLGTSGYQKFSSGLIIQWGAFTTSGSGYSNWTFPTAFSTAVYQVVCMNNNGTPDSNIPLPWWNSAASSTTVASIAAYIKSSGYAAVTLSCTAIGQ